MIIPIIFQRIEGGVILITALYFVGYLGLNWVLFFLLLFIIDITIIGYLINLKIGAIVYNFGHSLVVPPLLLIAWSWLDYEFLLLLALIWFAHIGLDRMIGYGLKSITDFKDTHLGRIGKNSSQ